MMKTKQHNDPIDPTRVAYAEKKELNYHDQSDRVPTVMKIRQDNNMIDRIDVVNVKNKTKMS